MLENVLHHKIGLGFAFLWARSKNPRQIPTIFQIFGGLTNNQSTKKGVAQFWWIIQPKIMLINISYIKQ